MFSVYKGAWGTTLVYFIGYLIVSRNPERHYGVVVTGGIGKLGYILTLMQLYSAGIASPIVFIIVIGDAVFVLLFCFYFYRLVMSARLNPERTTPRATAVRKW